MDMSASLEDQHVVAVGRQAVSAALLLGAKTAREAAELALKRRLSEREWEMVREAWERRWSDR
jgi:hypothetical protein